MIIHEKFVWLHLGKTGGSTVAKIFQKCQFPGVEEIIHDCPEQHWTIEQFEAHRGRPLAGREVIFNIRPLIPWIQSHQYQKERRQDAPFRKHRYLAGEIPFRRKDGDFDWHHADHLLSRLLHPAPTCFIRQPHLPSDFIRVFGRYFEFTEPQLAIINETHANPPPGPIPKHLHLSPEERAVLEQCCPLWMEVIEKAEGAHPDALSPASET